MVTYNYFRGSFLNDNNKSHAYRFTTTIVVELQHFNNCAIGY